jgi:hypothetical protein
MKKDLKIGILLIATNQYKQFIEQLLKSVNEYFFFGKQLNVYLFIDDISHEFVTPSRIDVRLFKIEPLKFPYATLFRYHIFSQVKKYIDCDYVFYSDVDMRFVDFVGEEILPLDLPEENQLVAVRHCGFYGKGGGAWETRKESTAYVPTEKRLKYFAGGFQGGQKDAYLSACEMMRDNIEIDRKNGIIPVWHDESIYNQYLSERLGKFRELTPDYCMVEEVEKRIDWCVNNFNPRLIALKKNHEEIRK